MTLPHNRYRLESQRTSRRTRRFQLESLEPRCLLAMTISEFPVPTAGSFPVGITTGPDGNLWFTEQIGNTIGQINPTTHAFAEFPVPTASSLPGSITTGPDGNLWFTEVTGNNIGQVGNSASTTTTVVLSVPQTIQTFGQAIPITAQVDSNGQPASGATGTMTFSEGSTILAAVAVTGGSATYAPTGLGTGAHVITATYSGSGGGYNGSTSQATQTVVAATTYTILTSSAQVAIFGQPITYSASSFSIAPGVGVPTGRIAFYDGSTLIGSSALVNGQTSLVVTASNPGAVHDIHAVYTPDSANFLAHTTGNLHDSVIKSNSSVLFYYQVSPRGVGFPTTVIGTLPGAGLPTGTLTLYVNGKVVGSQQLVNGMGGIFVPRNVARGKTFAVAYSGDANFNANVSKPITITQAILDGGSSPIRVFRVAAARALRGQIA